MEPKQSEQPTKSIAEVEATPLPWNSNMDNHNNNRNTSPTSSTTNEDKNNEGDGVKAPKRGRQKSVPLEEMSSPPQKKPSIENNKGMEAEKHAIFQSPSFYNNYAGYAFPHPHAYDHPSWSPMQSGSPSSPTTIMLSQSPFQEHKFGSFRPPPIPVATSTPLNPLFVCSTSSQIDSSMMDVQKETSWELSVSGEDDMSEGMWDTTAVWNTNMDLSNSWDSNSMEDQSNDYDHERNGPTSSGESLTVGPQLTMLIPMQKMPITPKPQFVTPNPMFYPHQFDHPNHFPYPPYSTGHLPMPIYQENEVQTIIVKENKREHSGDAKDGNGSYRNCLVCGHNNFACGKNNGLQVCNGCRLFFKRMVESGKDKAATFECFQGSGNCIISKEIRNSCHFCRFQACLKAGMDRQKIVGLKGKREKTKREQEKQNGPGNDN